ncbi:hypothetical protein WAI453_005679 [Rhynchosporium graminicola]
MTLLEVATFQMEIVAEAEKIVAELLVMEDAVIIMAKVDDNLWDLATKMTDLTR